MFTLLGKKILQNPQKTIHDNPASLFMVVYLVILVFGLKFDLFRLSNLQRTILGHSIGPICISYLLYRWGQPLAILWGTKGGKIFYVLASATMYATSRTLADRVISSNIQSVAAHFPNAQNNLTLYFIILLTVFLIGVSMKSVYYIVIGMAIIFFPLLLILKLFFDEIIRANPDMESWRSVTAARFVTKRIRFATGFALATDLFVILLGGIYITQFPLLVERPSWIKDESGQYISLVEEILIVSSFYPNRLSDGVGSNPPHLICNNLSSDARVAIVNPNDVVPSDVVVAEVNHSLRDLSSSVYNYKLSKCQNTNDPDHARRETVVLDPLGKPPIQTERDSDKRTDI